MKIIYISCMIAAFILGITGIGKADNCIMLMIFIIAINILCKEDKK